MERDQGSASPPSSTQDHLHAITDEAGALLNEAKTQGNQQFEHYRDTAADQLDSLKQGARSAASAFQGGDSLGLSQYLGHISDLVDALEQRLSPGQLMDQLLAYSKGNGGEFFHNLDTTLKNNPVPTALTVLGLAWLGLNQNRPFNPGPAQSGAGLGEKLGEAVDSVKGAFAHAGEALQDANYNMRSKAHDLPPRTGESDLSSGLGFPS